MKMDITQANAVIDQFCQGFRAGGVNMPDISVVVDALTALNAAADERRCEVEDIPPSLFPPEPSVKLETVELIERIRFQANLCFRNFDRLEELNDELKRNPEPTAKGSRVKI